MSTQATPPTLLTNPVVQVLPGFSYGQSRALPPGWLGVNIQLESVAGFSTFPEMLSALGTLGVGRARFPGGSVSKRWDWNIGKANAQQPGPFFWSSHPPDLSWQDDVSSSVRPVCVLDPSSHEIPFSDQVSHILQGVACAQVELGNERYLDAKGLSVTDGQQAAATYLGELTSGAAQIQSLVQHEPSTRFGIPFHSCKRGDLDNGQVDVNGSKHKGEIGWSAGTLAALSATSGTPFALVIHPYESGSYGTTPTWAQFVLSPETLIATGFVAVPRALEGIGAIASLAGVADPGWPVWFTEANVYDDNGYPDGTWAHGLTLAGYILACLEQDRVEMFLVQGLSGKKATDLDVHLVHPDATAFQNVTWTTPPSVPPGGLTATGLVLQIFASAMGGATTATRLVASPDSPITAARVNETVTFSGVHGWVFSESGTQGRAVIVNLHGSSQYRTLPGWKCPYELWSAGASQLVAEPGSVQHQSGSTPRGMHLPPWSILVIDLDG